MLKTLATLVGATLLVLLGLGSYVYFSHVAYAGPTEEVSFASGELTLGALWVRPRGPGPHPAIVWLHGSGPETRADPVRRVAANALVRTGYAVLLFDKRGVGASEGDFDAALYPDFIADGKAAVEYVASRPDVDAAHIGLYAVSEGAWFAPQIAVDTGKVAFIFHKVGTPLSVMDTVLWEVRNEYIENGASEEEAERLKELARLRWEYYVDTAADPTLATGQRREAINSEIRRVREEIPIARDLVPSELWAYAEEDYRDYAINQSYDPMPYVLQLDIPLYYALGELDPNLPTRQTVSALETLIQEQGKDISYRVFDGVGHGLVTWRGATELGYVPGFLEALGRWSAERLN